MLKLPLPGTARRRVSVLCTALVIAAGATAAWAAQPGAIAQPQSNAVESERPATATYQGQSETTPSEVTVRSASPPAYPREAREARQQGTVILRVLVGIRAANPARSLSRHPRTPRRWMPPPSLRPGSGSSTRGSRTESRAKARSWCRSRSASTRAAAALRSPGAERGRRRIRKPDDERRSKAGCASRCVSWASVSRRASSGSTRGPERLSAVGKGAGARVDFGNTAAA